MPTIKRIRAGKIAKSIGRGFENICLGSAERDGMVLVRIPDGCETRKTRSREGWRNALIRVRSPFDYCLFFDGRAAVFDAKTIDANTFAYSSIDPYQLHHLKGCARAGVSAGYCIWFRPQNMVCWFSVVRLQAIARRESLRVEDASFQLGPVGSFTFKHLFEPVSITGP